MKTMLYESLCNYKITVKLITFFCKVDCICLLFDVSLQSKFYDSTLLSLTSSIDSNETILMLLFDK